MRSRSPRAAGAATLGLTLGAAAAAGLHAPDWVWIAAAIAAAVCLVVAGALYLLDARPHTSSPSGITAGGDITAGRSIESDSGIQAGGSIEAGSDIKAAVPDRMDLLREQYKKGRALQAATPWLVGPAPASQHQSQQGNTRKREAIYKWANATWETLGQHFPGRETGFCPYAARWGHSSFFLAADEEAVAIGSPDQYLEKKLVFLAELLRTYDS